MAYEALVWPNEPTLTDGNDGTDYTMGTRFSLAAPSNCVGVRWRAPDTPSIPGGEGLSVQIWVALTETLIASKTFAAPAAGQYVDVLFDTPIALAAATNYVASVHTRNYVFSTPTPSSGWVLVSPSGNLSGDESKLANYGAGPVYPGGTFTAWYYVSPLIETAGGVDVVLTARPAGTIPAGAPATFAAGGVLNPRPAASQPAGTAASFAAGSVLTARPAATMPSGTSVALRETSGLNALPAATLPAGAPVVFLRGDTLAVRPAGTLPAGAIASLSRGDVLTGRAAETLPGASVITLAEVAPSAGTSTPNPPLLTVTRARAETTVSRPHISTTGAM